MDVVAVASLVDTRKVLNACGCIPGVVNKERGKYSMLVDATLDMNSL